MCPRIYMPVLLTAGWLTEEMVELPGPHPVINTTASKFRVRILGAAMRETHLFWLFSDDTVSRRLQLLYFMRLHRLLKVWSVPGPSNLQ